MCNAIFSSSSIYKRLCKSAVIDFWENKLRQEAAILPSLSSVFNPSFHSLCNPHPLLWTPGGNPHEVSKAVVQCKMLSGRYPTALLTKHWTSNNSDGSCSAPSCNEVPESLEHILLWCPMYQETREKISRLWLSTTDPVLLQLLVSILEGPTSCLLQFILDPSIHPTIISICQAHGNEILKRVFHLSRTWCFAIHKERTKKQGSWKFP